VARGKGVVVRRLAPLLPLRYREFDARLTGGGVVVVRFDEWVGRHYLQHGSFDPAELEFMTDALEPGATAIDVGANVGVYTVTAARRVGPAGRVLAVEADAEYVPRLCANLALNDVEGSVQVIAAAAGDSDGTAAFEVAADRAFSSIKPLVAYRGAGISREVPLRRLDTIWAEAGEPQVDFVKVDVEGAEVEVIAGAERLLERCRPALVVEVTPERTETEVRSRLGALGYEDVTPPTFSTANRAYRIVG